MRPFDRAWLVLKMPYHGTTETAAQNILQEGLLALPQWDGSSMAMSTLDPKEAERYAFYAAQNANDKPAVLHISDDAPGRRPAGDNEEYLAYDGEPHEVAVKPEYISRYQKPSEDEEMKEWDENRMQRYLQDGAFARQDIIDRNQDMKANPQRVRVRRKRGRELPPYRGRR